MTEIEDMDYDTYMDMVFGEIWDKNLVAKCETEGCVSAPLHGPIKIDSGETIFLCYGCWLKWWNEGNQIEIRRPKT